MRAKTAAAWALLLAIPLSGSAVYRRTDSICSQVYNLAEAAEKNYGLENSCTEISEAIYLWRRNDSFLSSFATHGEIDAVTADLRRAEALFLTGDKDEYFEALSEIKCDLEVVRDFDLPSIKSIF